MISMRFTWLPVMLQNVSGRSFEVSSGEVLEEGPGMDVWGVSREHHHNTTMNLRSGLRPINGSIDRSVDILPGEQGVIGCLASCPSQTLLQNVS